jgi:hypothetical protein
VAHRVVEAVAEVVLELEEEVEQVQLLVLEPVSRMDVVQVRARLLVLLLLLFRRRAVRLPQEVAVARQVVVVAAEQLVVEAEAVAEVVVEHRQLRVIARAPQFPASRSSTPCSQRALIRMWH